jgi:hypothetical protein
MRLLDGCSLGATLTFGNGPLLSQPLFQSATLCCHLSINRLLHTFHVGQAKVNPVKAIEPRPSALPKPRKLTLVWLQIMPDRLLDDLQRLDRIYTKGISYPARAEASNSVRAGPLRLRATPRDPDLNQNR